MDIKATGHQSFSHLFEGEYIRFTMMFRQGSWFMDVEYKGVSIHGLRVACGVLMLTGKNYPFEVTIDNNSNGLDPYSIDSFELELFNFILLEREETAFLRGYEVE